MRVLGMSVLLLAVCAFVTSFVVVFADEPTPAEIIEFRVPPPPSVGVRKLDVGVEYGAPIGWPTVLKAKDGRVMMIGEGKMQFSSDNGLTWSEAVKTEPSVDMVIRMQSGKLGGFNGSTFYTSEDEGKTWVKQGVWDPAPMNGAWPYPNTLIQTKTGRLVLPMRWTSGAGHDGLYALGRSFGTLNGKLVPEEGHAHFPEPDNACIVYSDDEGKSWHKSEGGIMIWDKNGYGGMWPCDEPSIIEGRNGDVVLFARTTLGRLYTARSTASSYIDESGNQVSYVPGQRFDYPKPTILCNSYSPCAITRIAKTGDWLLVWNQVSGDEIRASYRRGRLSSAISQDDGKTWKFFRTIDTSVLPPAGYVAPDPIPQMARGLDYVGVLPDDYGSVSYPSVSVVDDTVYLTWDKGVVKPRPGDVYGRRMRALPLSWFYQEDAPLPPSTAKLLLQISAGDSKDTLNTWEIPSQFFEGRFYCKLSDLAVYLKSPVGRLGYDMFAPVEQVVSCLGWIATFDRSKIDDPQNPSMTMTCRQVFSTSKPIEIKATEPVAPKNSPIPKNAVRLMPQDALPDFYKTAVGSKKTVSFDLPFSPSMVKGAWMEMEADSIHQSKEATIILNGKTEIAVDASVLGAGPSHSGWLVIPAKALVKGKNTFEFTFTSNLDGITAGYTITNANLALELK